MAVVIYSSIMYIEISETSAWAAKVLEIANNKVINTALMTKTLKILNRLYVIDSHNTAAKNILMATNITLMARILSIFSMLDSKTNSPTKIIASIAARNKNIVVILLAFIQNSFSLNSCLYSGGIRFNSNFK